MLCQLARQAGAVVIGIVSTDAKAAWARSNGATHIITSEDNLPTEVMRITGGRGVQVVYDGIGLSLYAKLLECLGKRGHYINFGNAGGKIEALNPFDLSPKCLTFMRPSLFNYIETREQFLDLANKIIPLVEGGKV